MPWQNWGDAYDWELAAEVKQGFDAIDAYLSKQAAFEAYCDGRQPTTDDQQANDKDS